MSLFAASEPEPHRLFFVYMPGCSHCEDTRPHVDAWAAARPWVKLVPVDLTATEWKMKRWAPRITPTLILVTATGYRIVREGAVDQAGIEKWVRSTAPHVLQRPRAAKSVIESKRQ